jgi:hypothetical protein
MVSMPALLTGCRSGRLRHAFSNIGSTSARRPTSAFTVIARRPGADLLRHLFRLLRMRDVVDDHVRPFLAKTRDAAPDSAARSVISALSL